MSSRTKRRHAEFDPNKSDSDDLDYGASSPPSRSRKSKKSSTATKRKPAKRARRAYGSQDDDDVEEDSDEISEDSSAQDTPEEEAELNPRTGRRVRGAAKKNITYQESSEEEIEETGNSGNDSDEIGPTSRSKRQSLVSKLNAPRWFLRGLSPRASARPPRSRGKSGPTPPSSDMVVTTRRSSRLSNDNAETALELTDSGKHAQPARSRTSTPDVPPRKSSRAAKGLKKPPSTIIEASQEQSGTSKQDDDEIVMENEDVEEEDADKALDENVLEAEQPQEETDEDVHMAETEVQDSIHGDVDDEDEEPVRIGRNLRVGSFAAEIFYVALAVY